MDDRTAAGTTPAISGKGPAEVHDFLNSAGWHKRVEEARLKRAEVLAAREPRAQVVPKLTQRRKGSGADRLPILEPVALGVQPPRGPAKHRTGQPPEVAPPEVSLSPLVLESPTSTLPLAVRAALAEAAPLDEARRAPAGRLRMAMMFALGLAAGACLAAGVLLLPSV